MASTRSNRRSVGSTTSSQPDISSLSNIERLLLAQAVYEFGADAWLHVSKLLSKHPLVLSRPKAFFNAQVCPQIVQSKLIMISYPRHVTYCMINLWKQQTWKCEFWSFACNWKTNCFFVAQILVIHPEVRRLTPFMNRNWRILHRRVEPPVSTTTLSSTRIRAQGPHSCRGSKFQVSPSCTCYGIKAQLSSDASWLKLSQSEVAFGMTKSNQKSRA